jgi:hypothetical protein
MSDSAILAIAFLSIGIPVIGAVLLGRRLMQGSRAIGPGTPEGFARLLVAELALYHRRSLDRARSETAIYRFLKVDIDRSRNMFLARFPDAEAVWYAAVVSILARGQASRLGVDYPYPRTDTAEHGALTDR